MVDLFDHLLTNVNFLFNHPFLLFIIFFSAAVLNTFFPPIPIETAVLFTSSFTGRRYDLLIIIIASSTLGMFLGSVLLYALARRYGTTFLHRTFLRKAVTDRSLQRAEGWFKKYGTWALFAGKLIPGMNLVVVVAAGLFHFHVRKAVLVFFTNNFLFFGVLANVGRSLGANWKKVMGWMNEFGIIALGVVLTVFLVYYFYYRRLKITRD